MLDFKETLLAWWYANPRPLPWKATTDPYKIWLSEIILQQTRVEQGLPYYLKFTTQYPTVQALAKAPDDEVMKLWEGLGYYARARNMLAAARYVSDSLDGVFPNTYEGLRQLKGVGDYTAAAIASFAYQLPYAVVDGNVYRVLARVYGITAAIDDPKTKQEVALLAQQLLDKSDPASYNQAIMDFGATHCTPKLAKCQSCPFSQNCWAYRERQVDKIPYKAQKIIKKQRFFGYTLYRFRNTLLLNRRVEGDIWAGLYEFPMAEFDHLPTAQELEDFVKKQLNFEPFELRKISLPYKQVLTHQQINAIFVEVDLPSKPKLEGSWVEQEKLADFAFPRIVNSYLDDKQAHLDFL